MELSHQAFVNTVRSVEYVFDLRSSSQIVSVRSGPVSVRFAVPFGSVRFGSVRFGSVRGSVRFRFVRFGPVRFDSMRFGLVWLGSVRFGSIRFRSVPFASVLGSMRSGPVRSDSVRLFCRLSFWLRSSIDAPFSFSCRRVALLLLTPQVFLLFPPPFAQFHQTDRSDGTHKMLDVYSSSLATCCANLPATVSGTSAPLNHPCPPAAWCKQCLPGR